MPKPARSTRGNFSPTALWARACAWDGQWQGLNYWASEKPKFAIEQGPAWLKSLRPPSAFGPLTLAAGRSTSRSTATIDRKCAKLDDGILCWGTEKLISTSTNGWQRHAVGSRFEYALGRHSHDRRLFLQNVAAIAVGGATCPLSRPG